MTNQVEKIEFSGSTAVYYLGRKETTAERIRRLQAEARILARQHIETLERAMLQMTDLANEVAVGGDAYPVGIRELSSRMAEDISGKLLTLRALIDRAPEAKL